MLRLYIEKMDPTHLAEFQTLLHQTVALRPVNPNTVELVCNGVVQALLSGRVDPNLKENYALASLTPRQKQVLALLGQGLPNREMAQKLAISEKAVEKHISAILSKLELKSRSQAVVWVAHQHRSLS